MISSSRALGTHEWWMDVAFSTSLHISPYISHISLSKTLVNVMVRHPLVEKFKSGRVPITSSRALSTHMDGGWMVPYPLLSIHLSGGCNGVSSTS